MKKFKCFYVVMIVFALLSISYGENKVRLDGLINPESIIVDTDNVYIADGASVNVFSKKDHKLITKFGKRGDGPKEFALFSDRGIRIYLKDNKILVNSVMKLSFWTKKGEFISSIKPKKFSALYIPIEENYIGSGRAIDKKVRYKTVNIYDPSLEPIKEIMRSKELFQPGFGVNIAGDNNYRFEVGGNKIYTCNNNDFEIEVFNENGKKIKDIKMDFKRVKITKKYRAMIIHHFKTDPKFKKIYNMLKPITFGDYFPAVEDIKYNNGKLYIMTGSWNDLQEIIVLKTNGDFIKKLNIPMKYKNALKQRYPYVIESGKLYQIVENSDDEEWDLFVFDLKEKK